MKYTKTIRASRNVRPSRPVRASRPVRGRAVKADEEFEDIDIEDVDVDADIPEADADVTVDEAATELLFEAEDVAELVSEVTGLPVDVTVDDSAVVFAVGDDEFTVTPEGDEEIVEQSTRMRKGARRVSASRRLARPARKVAATRKVSRK